MEKNKILLVDDDAAFLKQNQEKFVAAGYKVTTAKTMPEAEKLFTEGKPDAVIVDLMMEYADSGIVLAYRFKKASPKVPVIMVTSVTRETGMIFDAASSDEKAWLKADKVLAKPVRFEQLKREVETLLN